MKVKWTIFDSILIPILIYGAETWNCSVKEVKQIGVPEMNVRRTVFWKTKKNRVWNECLSKRVEVASMLNKGESATLR